MSIHFECECGRKLHAPDDAVGRRGRCPACQNVFTVPAPERVVAEEPLPMLEDAPRPVPVAAGGRALEQAEEDEYGEIPLAPPAFPAPAPTRAAKPVVKVPLGVSVPQRTAPRAALPLEQGDTSRGYLYLVLLLALIPLAWSTLQKGKDDGFDALKSRVLATVAAHPEVQPAWEALPEEPSMTQALDTVFTHTNGHRIDGAFLAHDTSMHWVLAAVSGVGFIVALMLLFPAGHAKPHGLAGIALFTGTVGILLLLALQWLAFHMPLFRGRGWITLLLDLLWLIGQSYRMALGDHGFVLSFLGFTAGVGLCEEVCKALPLLFKARSTGFSSWRSAMLWGLISGVGFGVSEGITYSSDYYNGVSGPGIYAVRFVSCVGLHAIWAGAVGITIFRRQDFLRASDHVLDGILRMAAIVLVPMTLHGAYDTLLKQDHDVWALGVAVVSFGWLAFQIETAKRQFDESAGAAALA